ncbi:MAG: hypothetical protein QXR58_01300 [Candidatus Micrarchaeaceae archaeon]
MAKANASAVFVLEFIGSLIYLGVIALMGMNFSTVLSGYGSLWTPLLYGTAVLASVALFITSFANFSRMGEFLGKYVFCEAAAAAFSLFILTAGVYSNIWFGFSIVGFIIAMIGAAMGGQSMFPAKK